MLSALLTQPVLADFSSTEDLAHNVKVYRFGVALTHIRFEQDGGHYRVERAQRDPASLQVSSKSFVLRSERGALLFTASDGSEISWHSPTHVTIKTALGLRRTYRSQYPIIKLEPEFIPLNRRVIHAYLLANPVADRLTVSIIKDQQTYVAANRFQEAAQVSGKREDASLEPMTFTREESRRGVVAGVERTSTRWAGETVAHRLYAIYRPFDLLFDEQMNLLGWQISGSSTEVAVLEGYQSLTPLVNWDDGKTSLPNFTTALISKTVLIPARDGTALATTVWLPGDREGNALAGPFPTILVRTPYDRWNFDFRPPWRFVSRGYAAVSQDTRGRFESGGEFIPLVDERLDGDDTLNWIAAQPWSDGNVGMIGGSYLGLTQWHAASTGNPHLKALVSYVPVAGGFVDMPYMNGGFMSGGLTWSIMVQAPERYADSQNMDLNAVLAELPLIDADLRAVEKVLPLWRSWLAHDTLDEYWQAGYMPNYADKLIQPVLHITGWYDDVLRGTIHLYDLMKANHRPNQNLVVGPWPHGGNSGRRMGDVDFGPDAAWHDEFYLVQRWFDRWLKGIDNNVEGEPVARYFNMGENRWRTADHWPPADVQNRPFYLHSTGVALQPEDGARLDWQAPQVTDSSDQYQYDPNWPAPYLVDVRLNQLSMPEDYQDVERRQDTVVYTSQPLQTALQITGAPRAILFAESNARDTDWIVRLSDVHPDGRSINLVEGVVKASYRQGWESTTLIEPGRVYRYEIPMMWTSNLFKAGHSVRVMITSSAAGWLHVNTNTGNDFASDTETFVATQTIHHDVDYPTHVLLPVIAE